MTRRAKKRWLAVLALVVIVGVMAVGLSVMKQRERAKAQRAKIVLEATQEHALADVLGLYECYNGDVPPEDMAQLVPYLGPDTKLLLSPRSGTTALGLSDDDRKAAKKDWKSIQRKIDDHVDFALAPYGPKTSAVLTPSDLSHLIVIYPRASVPTAGGTNLLFADSHVENVPEGDLKGVVERNNDVRMAAKMPLLKVDESGHIVPG